MDGRHTVNAKNLQATRAIETYLYFDLILAFLS